MDGFATIAAPLTALTRKDVEFKWAKLHQDAFDTLRNALIRAPLLTEWDPEAQTIMEADAGGYAIGAVFTQQQTDNSWKPAAYYSSKLDPTQVNWPIHDKEMWAVVAALRNWRAELLPVNFKVHNNPKNLGYFRQVQKLSERQMRWADELQQYDFMLVHKPGTSQVTSDALSRRDQDLPSDCSDERLQSREQQLLEGNGEFSVRAFKGWLGNADADNDGVDPTPQELADAPSSPFRNVQMNRLWSEALQAT